MPKFYDLETLTQEDLNNLALERNTLIQKIDYLIKYLEDKIKDCDYQIEIIGNYQKICEKRAYQDILERVKSGKYE